MLVKRPKGNIFFKSIKFIVAAEVVLFAGSYVIWRQMNTSRDFRLFLHKRAPFILNQFYSFGKSWNKNYDLEVVDKTYWRENNLL